VEEKGLGPIEQAMIMAVLQGELEGSFADESKKGRDTTIHKEPVCLEPPFQPYVLKSFLTQPANNIQTKPNNFVCEGKKVFLRLWFSERDESERQTFEMLIRELSITKTPIEFLLIGNKKRISCQLGMNEKEVIIVKNIITSRFPNLEIDVNEESCFYELLQQSTKTGHLDFRDFFSQQPYWKNLQGYEDIKETPLLPIYSCLNELEKDEFGFYQIIMKSASDNWRENIINLVEAELGSGRYGSLSSSSLVHAGFGSDFYKKARKKLESPYFSTSIRIGAYSTKEKIGGTLNSLSLVMAGLQHGNTGLNHLSKTDYFKVFEEGHITKMIGDALVHRCGMLLTADELSTVCHFPTKEVLKRNYSLDKAAGFKATSQCQQDGVILGTNEYAGKTRTVMQREKIRNLHTSISGLTGKGKSIQQEGMILDDIRKGHGVAFIDPHSDSARKILRLIPEHRKKDVIFFDPCDDDEYIFAYNPFELMPGEDLWKRLDDLLVTIKDLYTARDWGHVIESTLVPLFYTLLVSKNLSLSDAPTLLSKTSRGEKLRRKVMPFVEKEEMKHFWNEVFPRMSQSTMDRVLNKLSKFLLQERVSRIFSQKKNSINFRKIIDEKKIFIADLNSGKLGAEASNILGSFLISQFYHAAMSRLVIGAENRTPFNVYIDECGNFKLKSFEHAILHLRKCNVRLILSFQQHEAMPESMRLALGNCGTMIVLDLDWNDAHRVFKDFCGIVEVNEFMLKGTGKSYLRMIGDIISLDTLKPIEAEGDGFMKEIIENTRQNYCIKLEKKTAKEHAKHNQETEEFDLYDEI